MKPTWNRHANDSHALPQHIPGLQNLLPETLTPGEVTVVLEDMAQHLERRAGTLPQSQKSDRLLYIAGELRIRAQETARMAKSARQSVLKN